jgi:N-acetylglutamate synthase
MDDSTIRTLEKLAFRAWPAEVVEDIDGWSARWTRGVTRRGNSVSPRELRPGVSSSPAALEKRIDRVEQFYTSHGLDPLFQVGKFASPPDLDSHLAKRGYEIEAAVSAQMATPRQIASSVSDTGWSAGRVDTSVSDAWLAVGANGSRFKDVPEVLQGFLKRIGGRARFALAFLDGEPACAALLVCEPPWAGLYAMVTAAQFRRRGVGRQLMRGIADWAPTEWVSQVYLLVEDDNEAARELYGRCGFVPQYSYHYRRRRG